MASSCSSGLTQIPGARKPNTRWFRRCTPAGGIFGAYALVDGLFAIAASIRGTAARRRWLLLAGGILGVAAGLVAFFYPGMTTLVLLYVIAFWAIFTGILKVVMAISLRREIENEWLMGSGGVISVLFGIMLAVLPGVGLLSLVWLIGIYAIVFGVAQIALGFRVQSHRRDAPSREQGQAS